MKLFSLLLSCFALSGMADAMTTDEVLTRMDQGAAKFTSMSADLARITYTKVIDDKSTETGTVLLKKNGPKDLQVFMEFNTPDAKSAAFRGKKAEIYYPKLKTVQEYDLGKHSDVVDQFLLIGFGTTGRDLKTNYTIKYIADEVVAGQKTHKLELVPLAAQRKEKLRKMELWLAEHGAYPVQQKFLMPSGDYYIATYSNIKLNPTLPEDALKLKLPKGVKREFPQK